MKILFVHPNNRITGQEISLLQRMCGLRDLGLSVDIALPSPGAFSEKLKAEGFSVTTLPLNRLSKRNVFSYISTLINLFFLFLRERYDIIHCSGIYPLQYCLPVARMLRRKCLAHITTTVYTPYDIRVTFSKHCDFFVACAEAVKKHFVEVSGIKPDKVVAVYNGIADPTSFGKKTDAQDIREEFNISAEVKLIGQLAEVIPRKGYEYFVEMAALVKKEYSATKFLIIGTSHNDAYEKLVREKIRELGLAEDVLFTGFRRDYRQVLQALDVSVLCSLAEGLSRVIVETQYLEKPIVATAVSGNVEAIENSVSGLLVPPQDPQAMADAVLSLLRDPDKARAMGEEGRRRAFEKFSPTKQAKRILNIYQQL